MDDKESIKQVTDRLISLLACDSVKAAFHDVTALSLVEITRQRVREPLEVQIKYSEK